MADAVRILVDKEVYQQTLNRLDDQLGQLKSHRDNMERQLSRLKSGDIFSGSDVKETIRITEEGLEKVKDAISRVEGYRSSIQQQLSGVESAASQLRSSISNIDLPNLFN